MTMDTEQIKELILSAIPDSTITLSDLRGDGDHYAAHIVSASFEGKSRIQQHQMVYEALQGKIDHDLHALAIQTSLPN